MEHLYVLSTEITDSNLLQGVPTWDDSDDFSDWSCKGKIRAVGGSASWAPNLNFAGAISAT